METAGPCDGIMALTRDFGRRDCRSRRWVGRLVHDARQRQRSLTLRTPAQRGPGRRLRQPPSPGSHPGWSCPSSWWRCCCSTRCSRAPTPTRSSSASSRRRWPTARSSRTTTIPVRISDNQISGQISNRRGHQGLHDAAVAQRAGQPRRRVHQLARGSRHRLHLRAAQRAAVGDPQLPAVPADHVRRVLVRVPADGLGRHGRAEHGQEQGQDLRPQGAQDHVRRRRGRRRGQGRAPRDRRVPVQPEEVPAAGRTHPQGRAAARASRVWQDVARARRRR